MSGVRRFWPLAVGLLATAALWTWDQARFPARSENVPRTPIELRVQEGILAAELAALRDGLRLGDRQLRAYRRR